MWFWIQWRWTGQRDVQRIQLQHLSPEAMSRLLLIIHCFNAPLMLWLVYVCEMRKMHEHIGLRVKYVFSFRTEVASQIHTLSTVYRGFTLEHWHNDILKTVHMYLRWKTKIYCAVDVQRSPTMQCTVEMEDLLTAGRKLVVKQLHVLLRTKNNYWTIVLRLK